MSTLRSLAAAPFALALLALAAPAAADTQELSGGCEFRAGADCTASCSNVSFEAKCDIDLASSCAGSCTASADASCTGSCEGTCAASCTANPGSFSCQGSCDADCSADCDAHCQAGTDGASSQADCAGKCKASCSGSCSAKCDAVPPSGGCDAECQGKCGGQCSASANASCQVKCQAAGSASCQANAQGSCSASCDTQGMIVCDGAVQAFVNDVKAAADWIAQHVVVQGSASASCTGSTCSADAEGSVSTKCSAVPGANGGQGWVLAAGALAAIVSAVAGRRRRG